VLVAVIADDVTGAADTGAQFARAGYRTGVAFHGAPVPPADDLDAVVVDTDSRLLAPADAAPRVAAAARALRSVPLVYKKVDSTLRGPVAAEIAAVLHDGGRTRAVVAPAFPAAGRTTRGGVHHVDGTAEADIARLLAAAGLGDAAVLSRDDIADPRRVAAAVAEHVCTIADAEEEADLEALVRGVPDPAGVLWVGSAGLAGALGALRRGPRSPAAHVEAAGPRVLAAIGTATPTARAQVRRLAAVPDVTDVPLRLDLLARGRDDEAVDAAVAAAAAALHAACPAVVHTTATHDRADAAVATHLSHDRRVVAASSADLARRIPPALAAVARRLAGDPGLDALVLSGGTTAVHVARALGASGLLVEAELEPGVPVSRLLGPRPYPVVTKAGAFGDPATLVHAVAALGGRLEVRTAGAA
jgi:uncharacterized protein YgbK (DUF1537 family)